MQTNLATQFRYTAVKEKMMKVIYDIGANNGDDIAYYLKKADKVVAIEANPILAGEIAKRYHSEILTSRLFVENIVLTAEDESALVPFYIHRLHHVLSQFPKPVRPEEFYETLLPSKSLKELIGHYGKPYYVKIDVEGYDASILSSLFDLKIFPPFLSAESHSIDVFALLVSRGNYKSFKLVEGATVPVVYRRHSIKTLQGDELYAFPPHSAGPFGDDISGDWWTADNFFRYLGLARLGWKDIHVSNIVEPNPKLVADIRTTAQLVLHMS